MTKQDFNMLNENIFFSFELNEKGLLKEPLYQGILNEKILVYSSLDNLDGISDNEDYFNIYGQTTKGKKFTAVKCFYKNRGSLNISMENSLYTMTKSIYLNQIFVGDWDSDIETNTIQKVFVQFSYLEHWLEKYQILSDYDQDNDEFVYKGMNPQFNIIDINTKLQFRVVNQLNSSQKQLYNKTLMTFDSQKFIELSFKDNINLDEMNKTIHLLKNFFEILLPTTEIFKIQLEITNSNDKKYQIIQEIKEEDTRVSSLDFLYLYDEDDIQKVLSNWFEIESKYKFLIASLSPIFKNNSFIYAENEFIYYMQWVEGFARVEYPTDEKEKENFQNQINKIIKQLDNKKDKKLIQGRFQFAYETPLRKQLEKILLDFNIKEILNLSNTKLCKLVNRLLTYRNRLTHTSDKKEYHEYEVIYLKNVLKQIIYIIFHTKLQFNDKSYAYEQVVKDLKFNYSKYIEKKW